MILWTSFANLNVQLQDPKGILEDDELPDGTKIKAGGMVTYVPYSMGRMEYNWGPDAASFVPERWYRDGVLKTESPFKFTAFQVSSSLLESIIYDNNPKLVMWVWTKMCNKHLSFIIFLWIYRQDQGYALARTLHIFRWGWC